jgi:hypothetical protein
LSLFSKSAEHFTIPSFVYVTQLKRNNSAEHKNDYFNLGHSFFEYLLVFNYMPHTFRAALHIDAKKVQKIPYPCGIYISSAIYREETNTANATPCAMPSC